MLDFKKAFSFNILNYLSAHKTAVQEGFRQFKRNSLVSLATVLVLAIALAFPVGIYLSLHALSQFGQHWNNERGVTLVLQDSITTEQREVLLRDLKKQSSVQSIEYISKEQALQEFEEASNLKDALTIFDTNPLPELVIIQPKASWQTPTKLRQLQSELVGHPAIKQVELDFNWLERLYAFIDFSKRFTHVLICLFGVGILLIVGNTIHLITSRYAPEIEIHQLLGASPRFIRRPFLYAGLLYGFLGALVAWAVLALTLIWLAPAIKGLAAAYGFSFTWQTLMPLRLLPGLILMGLFLGYAGSRLALSRRL